MKFRLATALALSLALAAAPALAEPQTAQFRTVAPQSFSAQDLRAALQAHYAHSAWVTVEPAPADLKLDAVALAGTNKMELRVFANDAAHDGFAHAVLVARLDNLGKGASGAAVQNLELMLGL